jgi:uncharacterized membrane protein HdeD (DUF308 family)
MHLHSEPRSPRKFTAGPYAVLHGKNSVAVNTGTTAADSSLLQQREDSMRPLTVLGAVLIVVGVIALFLGHFSFTETKPLVKAGPLQVNSEENHTVWIPTVAGIVVVLAGLGLVIAGRRT